MAMKATLPQRPSETARTASPYLREVAQRLRAVRLARGFSLQDVQALSGGQFGSAAIGSYERCWREPTVETIARYAAFLGIPVAQILDPLSLLPVPSDTKEIA